jgi:hypothetical protein
MRLGAAMFVVGVAAVGSTSAQNPSPDVVATLAGHVVDGITGEPVSGVAVALQPAWRDYKGPCGITGFSDGQFVCEVMAAGNFYLSASKHGYVDGTFGAHGPNDAPRVAIGLAAGTRERDVTLRLWRIDQLGSLSGLVRDPAGTPRPQALVSVFSADRTRWSDPAFMAGPAGWDSVRSSDTGEYHALLVPGDYFVIAATEMPLHWQNSETLAQLAKRATHVAIVAGEHKTMNVDF